MGINSTARFLQDCLNKRLAGVGTGSYRTSHLLIEKCAEIENKVAAVPSGYAANRVDGQKTFIFTLKNYVYKIARADPGRLFD